MRILVSAASRHESTAEIARRIADTLRRSGHEPVVIPPDEVAGVANFDAVVLGSAVYMGRWLPAARRFVQRHQKTLRERPVWLFSSGPVGPAALEPEQAPVRAETQMELTEAVEHRVFGGRLVRRRLSMSARIIVRRMHLPDRDERDWTEIEGWASQIADSLTNRIAAESDTGERERTR